MNCHLIIRHEIDAFYYIDLAIVGPFGTEAPKCWPHRTTVRDMVYIYEPQTAKFICVLSCYSYGVSFLAICHVGRVVHLEDDVALVIHICKPLANGICFGEPGDIAKCQVVGGAVKIPSIKEGTPRVLSNDVVRRTSGSKESEYTEKDQPDHRSIMMTGIPVAQFIGR